MVHSFSDADLDHGFRLLLESVPGMAVVMLDAEGLIARWNSGAQHLFGWSQEEAVGQPSALFFTPEDRAAEIPARELTRAASTGFAADDRWHLRKDGSRLHVTGTMSALRDDQGKLRGFLKLVREDTDLVLALERLKLAQSAGSVGTFDWLIPEDRLLWTPELEAMYGFKSGEFQATYAAWRELVHPDDLANVEQTLRTAIDRRQPFAAEFRIRRRDGAERWIVSRGVCHYDGEGRPARLVGVNIDSTERRRATAEAERGRRTLQALLEYIPLGITIVGSPPEARIEAISTYACRLVGRACETLTGHRIGEHSKAWGLREADGSTISDSRRLPLMRAVQHGETVVNEEWLIERPDGTKVPVLCSCGPVRDPQGTIVGAVMAFADITERRETEQRLLRANRELESFAYIASHDMQEPLRMIASYLGLLQRKYAGHLDARAHEYIGYAVDGAERMQKLIRQLLDYAKLDRSAPQLDDIDSTVAFDDALRILAERIAGSGARVSAGPLPRLRADPTLLTRLFQNLVGNAIKYSSKSRVPEVVVSAERAEHAWVFSVRDNGIGISPGDRERVFALFQRLHTRDEYPGTGLGLAICKRIVDRHGGRIWVESAPGEGSTFRFTIPDAPPVQRRTTSGRLVAQLA